MRTKFETDLKYGNSSEHKFFLKNADKLSLLDGRKGDLQLLKSGALIELKSERRTSTATGNLFLERYSHKKLCTPGGPWSAKLAGCAYIVYLFADEKLFCYNIDILIAWVNKYEKTLSRHNTAYSNSMGYIIPLIRLQDLEMKWEDIC